MGSQTFFRHCRSYQKLQRLAKNPIDLTKEGVLSAERVETMVAQACGFRFLYSTERVTSEVMSALKELAVEAKAVEKMRAMQRGEVVNSIKGFASENRAALHTAMRDFSTRPSTFATLALQQHEKLKQFLTQVEGRFTDLISIAIGGSDLGPKALFLALKHLKGFAKRVHFISNIDPDAIAQTLKDVELSKALVVVISKSGTTLETVCNETYLRREFRAKGLNPDEHFISITAKGSPMDTKERYRESFHMWDYVGGRFSATSMAGVFTLAFAYGQEVVWELLRGAHEMDRVACEEDLSKNLPLLGALLSIWNHNFLHYPTSAFIPYSEQLHRFPAHIQQVVMESNGKGIDRSGNPLDFDCGPIVWGEPGTSAQHSFYQLIHQGTTVVPLELVGFKESAYGEDLEVEKTTSQQKLLANLFAQALALAIGKKDKNPNRAFSGNRPSHILLSKKLTPFTLGSLLAYIEHKVVFEGFIWDINSFDQEGVELGKVLASKILSLFSKEGRFEVGEAFLKQLDHL